MTEERIDFISAYCDSWCERCAFTSRCSLYAVKMAEGMCGDFEEALHLAVGAPHPVGVAPKSPDPGWFEEANAPMTKEEIAAYESEEADRQDRVRGTPLSAMSFGYTTRAHDWLSAHRDALAASADPVVGEALEIVTWDSYLVTSKLHRALDGKDSHDHGGIDHDDDEHPVQNDWNGSAKVALVSMERSEAAWRTIALAADGDAPIALADALNDLQRQTKEEFPDALAFVRPGFDEPWR